MKRIKSSIFILLLSGIVIGSLSGYPSLIQYQKSIKHLPIKDQFHIEVIRSDPQKPSIQGKIINHENLSLNGMLIYVYDLNKSKYAYQMGEVYVMDLSLQPLNSPQFPTEMNKRLYYLSKNLIANGSAPKNIRLIETASNINQFRTHLATQFQQNDYQNHSYLTALSVGITEGLESEDWDVLRRTGTIHLVSISGLHISLIALWGFIIIRSLCGFFLIKRVPPYKIAAFLSIGLALSYAMIAGFSLPTQRAFIMFSVGMIALIRYYPLLTLHNLAFASILILIISPLSILSVGFWLSFTAVALLITLSRYHFRPWQLVLLTQLAVSIIVIPLTASFFGEISLISPLANLFAIPWTTITILPTLLIGILIDPLFPSISSFLFGFSDHCLTFMLWILNSLDQFQFSSLSIFKIHFITAIFFTLFVLLILAKQSTFKISTIFSLFLLSIIPNIKQQRTPYELHLLPVNQGLSFFINTPNQTILFDTGPYFKNFDAGKRIIIPTLTALNITKLDQLILSKENQQHIGGTRTVRRQYPNAQVLTQEPLLNYIDDAQDCHKHKMIEMNISVEPLKEISSSCAFKISIHQHSIWLIADITDTEWDRLLKNHPLPDILLFPNQGRSRYFNEQTLLADKPILLFSTKTIHSRFDQLIEQLETYNAYEGWVTIELDHSITIKHYTDSQRYWWASR